VVVTEAEEVTEEVITDLQKVIQVKIIPYTSPLINNSEIVKPRP
jgi:TolB-like protein